MNKKVKGWLELVLGVGISMKGVYDIIDGSVDEKLEEAPKELTAKSKYANMEEVEVVEEGDAKDDE